MLGKRGPTEIAFRQVEVSSLRRFIIRLIGGEEEHHVSHLHTIADM